MTKEIPLTQGKVALVDDADFDWLNQWKWYAAKRGRRIKIWYAARDVRRNGTHAVVLMHRLIAGAKKGQYTDHADGDGLNNRRKNIRACSPSNNSMNRRLETRSKTGFKGVCWHKQRGKFHARLQNKSLGLFDSAEDAARAYDAAAIKRSPNFARVNFPQGGESCRGS